MVKWQLDDEKTISRYLKEEGLEHFCVVVSALAKAANCCAKEP